jgi:hypothetical protein
MAGQASRENGKKGGRPVSEATLRAQAAREYISKQLQENLAPIVNRAITDAISGDAKERKDAREWLADRGWGKATQPLSGPLDEPLFDNEHYEQARTIIAGYLAANGNGDEGGD